MIKISEYTQVRIDKSQIQIGDLLDNCGIYSVAETTPSFDGLSFSVTFQPLVEFEENDTPYLVESGLRYHRSLRANGMQVCVLRKSSLK